MNNYIPESLFFSFKQFNGRLPNIQEYRQHNIKHKMRSIRTKQKTLSVNKLGRNDSWYYKHANKPCQLLSFTDTLCTLYMGKLITWLISQKPGDNIMTKQLYNYINEYITIFMNISLVCDIKLQSFWLET